MTSGTHFSRAHSLPWAKPWALLLLSHGHVISRDPVPWVLLWFLLLSVAVELLTVTLQGATGPFLSPETTEPQSIGGGRPQTAETCGIILPGPLASGTKASTENPG